MEAGHVLEAGLGDLVLHGDLRSVRLVSGNEYGTPQSYLKLAIIVVRHDDARKQVLDDREEQRDVVG